MSFPTRPRRLRTMLILAALVPALAACSNAAEGDVARSDAGRNQVFPFTTPQPA